MNRVGAVIYGMAAGVIALLFARKSLEPALYLFRDGHAHDVALGMTGWLVSTLGPIALSVCVLLIARRLKAPWLLHLLFIPAAIAIGKGGGYLFFYGAGVSGENSPEGYALLTAIMLLILTLAVHIAMLVVEGFKTIRHRASATKRIF
jgi:uncharacterized membrane protein